MPNRNHEMSDQIKEIIQRLASGQLPEAEIEQLQVAIATGKNGLTVGGKKISLGDGTKDSLLVAGDGNVVIQSIVSEALEAIPAETSPSGGVMVTSVDDLVQQVRARLYDDIQSLHGTMPLWGVDRWVSLYELFININILEEVSFNHRAELDILWKDFNQEPSRRSLDRIGLASARKQVPGLQLLTEDKNLVVVGKPGSGKSTYLQRIVTECNLGHLQPHRIPVLIKLREFVEDGREVAYSIERYLEQLWQLSREDTKRVLSAGRALVLLDGLDESVGTDGKEIAKQIKRYARTYPQVQTVVTCRTQSQESRFERFDYVEVADFNESQVRAFAKHWFRTVCTQSENGESKAVTFLEQLFQDSNKAIRELAITPILLSLACAVFHQTGKFYSKRFRLYEEGLALLLEQWDRSRDIEREEVYRNLSTAQKLSLLSHLAMKKFEEDQYVLFEQCELEGHIATFLDVDTQIAQSILQAIAAQHGLLIARAHSVWSFSHLTFQEYFVALEIRERQNEHPELLLETLNKHLYEPRWHEVLLLLLALQSPEQATEASKAILHRESTYEGWLHRDLFFVGEVLAEDILISSDVSSSAIQALINLAFDELPTTTKKMRAATKQALCSLGNTQYAHVALQQLKQLKPDLDYWELLDYRVVLGERPQVIQELEELATKTQIEFDIKFSAVLSLLELPPCSVVGERALLNMIKDKDPEIRMYDSLGNYVHHIKKVSDSFADELLSLIETDAIHRIDLEHFFTELCRVSERIREGLTGITKHERSEVRAFAISVLIEFGWSHGPAALIREKVSPIVMTGLCDPSAVVRQNTVYVLGHWEPDALSEAVITKVRCLLKDPDLCVQYFAASTLLNLEFQSEEVADIIINALKAFHDVKSRESVIDTQVRAEYILPEAFYKGTKILDTLDSEVMRLQDLLDSEDVRLQQQVLLILSNLSSPSQSLIDKIFHLGQSAAPREKTAVVSAWAKLYVSQQQQLNALEKCLLHKSSAVKLRAIRVLEENAQFSKQGTEWLTQLLSDADVAVQLSATKALSKLHINDLDVAVSLFSFLEYDVPQTKAPPTAIAAVNTLVAIGDRQPGLETHLVQWINKNIEKDCVGSGIDVLKALL